MWKCTINHRSQSQVKMCENVEFPCTEAKFLWFHLISCAMFCFQRNVNFTHKHFHYMWLMLITCDNVNFTCNIFFSHIKILNQHVLFSYRAVEIKPHTKSYIPWKGQRYDESNKTTMVVFLLNAMFCGRPVTWPDILD